MTSTVCRWSRRRVYLRLVFTFRLFTVDLFTSLFRFVWEDRGLDLGSGCFCMDFA